MESLGQGFYPSPDDVICARGKEVFNREGNRCFRALVKQQHLQTYSSCVTKMQKSRLVSYIVHTVRKASPNGGFVKRMGNRRYAVSDRHAKEKTGQTMRDQLHTRYSSSTKAKARTRQQLRVARTVSRDFSTRKSKPLQRRNTTVHITRPSDLISSVVEPLAVRSSISVGDGMSFDLDSIKPLVLPSTTNHILNISNFLPHRIVDRCHRSGLTTVGVTSIPLNDISDEVSLSLLVAPDLDSLPLDDFKCDLTFNDTSGSTEVSEESFSEAVDTLLECMHIQ